MRLSEVEAGTPIHIEAYKNKERIADIWGKIHRNLQNESQIEIYYYEGKNINLNSSPYEIKAYAYLSRTPVEISLNNAHIKELSSNGDALVENRDAFRIYISVVIDCIVDKVHSATALLIDLSESGFRVAVQGPLYPNKTSISLYVVDAGFDFRIAGNIVWGSALSDTQGVYGCRITKETDRTTLLKYIKKKQQGLYKEIQDEINGL